MTQDALFSKYGEHIAEDMFQHLCAHVGANLNTIVVKDDTYSLLGTLNEIRKGLILPQGCKLRLQGYDLFLDTPLPFFIKFGCGQLWIRARTIAFLFKEEKIKPDVAVAVLHYDSFEEDLQETIEPYVH